MTEHWQTIVFLVRHGQTEGDFSLNRAVDQKRPLTEFGQAQAQAVGQYLAQFMPVAIYSSPLDRCQKTAEIISKQFDRQTDIQTSEKLVESYSPSKSIREGVGDREETIMEMISNHHQGEQVVVVTHQAFIGSIVADLRGVSYGEVPCAVADIYRLVFADSKLVEATRLQPANIQ